MSGLVLYLVEGMLTLCYLAVGVPIGHLLARAEVRWRNRRIRELKEITEKASTWSFDGYEERYKLINLQDNAKVAAGLTFWLGVLAWPAVVVGTVIAKLLALIGWGVLVFTRLVLPPGVDEVPLTEKELRELERDALYDD